MLPILYVKHSQPVRIGIAPQERKKNLGGVFALSADDFEKEDKEDPRLIAIWIAIWRFPKLGQNYG